MIAESVEASEAAEADEVNEAAEVSKVWKITTEDFSHPGSWIQLYFDVLKNNVLLKAVQYKHISA